MGGSDNIDDWHHEVNARLEDARAAGRPVTVWVNPDNPAESVFDRELRWGEVLFLVPVLARLRRRGRGRARGDGVRAQGQGRRAAPRRPSTGPSAPRRAGPESASATPRFLWVFAFFWNAMSWPIAFLAVPDIVAKRRMGRAPGAALPARGPRAPLGRRVGDLERLARPGAPGGYARRRAPCRPARRRAPWPPRRRAPCSIRRAARSMRPGAPSGRTPRRRDPARHRGLGGAGRHAHAALFGAAPPGSRDRAVRRRGPADADRGRALRRGRRARRGDLSAGSRQRFWTPARWPCSLGPLVVTVKAGELAVEQTRASSAAGPGACAGNRSGPSGPS